MINQQKFGEEMNRATAMMRDGNIDGAGEIYYALYDMLCMDSYRQRLFQGDREGQVPVSRNN